MTISDDICASENSINRSAQSIRARGQIAEGPAVHFVISATWGPTDPTRAMLPFIFAASALQSGDEMTLMLFHDAVFMAVEGAGAKLLPVGPPNRYEEVAAHSKVSLWACKQCIDVRGLAGVPLDRRIKLGGMNDFHAAARAPDARIISY
jgi:tRNA 2-thiouridine synthesizing protein D